jgi:hypothetical protein
MPYVKHPVFVEPNDVNAPIWRYMSLAKLVSLLDKRALYFARADVLSARDRFEGSTSRIMQEALAGELRKHDIPEEAIQQMSTSSTALHRQLVGQTFLNCWTSVPHESVAMWRLYAGESDGVVIRSTFARLTDSLRMHAGRKRPVYVGVVRYVDYDTEPISAGNLMTPWVHKRRAFEFEREIRAVIQEIRFTPDNHLITDPFPERGRLVRVHLDTLIEEVRVSPDSPPSSVDLAVSILRRWRLPKPVNPSALDAEPTF